jgi:hypothetical protein
MAFKNLNNSDKQIIWSIKIVLNRILSDVDRDFIAELISEEARKTKGVYYFILHEIIESKKYSIIFIEGSRYALKNLLWVIKCNLPYEVLYIKRYDN